MATGQPTMLDIAKLTGNDAVVGLIEENVKYTPEMDVFPSRTITGTNFKTAIRTELPGVSFRAANEGTIYTKSKFDNRLHETYILSGNIRVDVAVAAAYEDGPEALKALESSGIMRQAMREIGDQIYYGRAVDGKGFPGLQEVHTAYSATLSDPIMVNATGTAANTGSSVYAVKFGPQDTQLLFGRNTTFGLSDWMNQMVNDGTPGQDYHAHVAALTSWVGLQVGSVFSVGRIKNLTAEAGKGMTDALVADLIGKFPIGYFPDALFMSRRSVLQLQKSRSATAVYNYGDRGTSGSDIQAPMPTESNGIRIIVTDSIRNNEPIEA